MTAFEILYLKSLKAPFKNNLLSYYFPSFLISFSDSDEEKKARRGRSPKGEFKDEEETVTTKHIHITQATETTTTRHKRTANPSKTIDLGAAAHYTGDKASPDQNASTHTPQSSLKVRMAQVYTLYRILVLKKLLLDLLH